MPKVDKDVAWAIAWVTEEAEMWSVVDGSKADNTRTARRLETVVKRLAREAGYSTETTHAD